jgi:hypothetical protein
MVTQAAWPESAAIGLRVTLLVVPSSSTTTAVATHIRPPTADGADNGRSEIPPSLRAPPADLG